MKVLSFDIEEWYLEKFYFGNRSHMYNKFDKYLGEILDTLDKRKMKGTFFCVGGLGREFPDVVKRIAERGHEVGCHSDVHTWLNKMTQEECLEDTRKAVDSLEQVIGEKVKSYRAPAFSIGASNKWAFEVLAECGIERDASIFPAIRDFGGFAEFGQKTPAIVRYNDITIKEFPICTTKLMGSEVAYSGGGYFRFFPLWFVKREMAKADYSMTYFHIDDLLAETEGVMTREKYEEYFKEPGTLKARYIRYIKSNLGKKSAFKKLKKLLAEKAEHIIAVSEYTKNDIIELLNIPEKKIS